MKKTALIYYCLVVLSFIGCTNQGGTSLDIDLPISNVRDITIYTPGNQDEMSEKEMPIQILDTFDLILMQAEKADFEHGAQQQTLKLLKKQTGYDREYILVLERANNKYATYTFNNEWMIYDIFFTLADLDGDTVPEIIVQIDVGGNGGIGSFSPCILRYQDGKFYEIWYYEDEYDTGFEGYLSDGFQLHIKNKFTAYSRYIKLSDQNKEMYFRPDGSFVLSDSLILVDSCYYFHPMDADHDGVFEIQTLQYVTLHSRADCIGYACTILKLDISTGEMHVVDTSFFLESEIELSDNRLKDWLPVF